MLEYSEAKTAGLIEPAIEGLTDALHEAGVHPLSSCAGHGGRSAIRLWSFIGRLFPRDPFRPFVMFSAPESYARSFQKAYDQSKGTHYCWTIEGHFHPGNYELVWTIKNIDERLERGEVDYRLLEHDFEVLAELAIQAA